MTASLALGLGCVGEEPVRRLDLVAAADRAVVSETARQRPRTDRSRELLFLPAGSHFEIALEFGRRCALRAERLALRGESSRLEVTAAPDPAESEPARTVLDPSAVAVEVELPEAAGSAVRLTLAVSGGGATGDGALLVRPAVWCAPEAPAEPEPASFERVERPHVVVYLIDTLRRDRLGVYGYGRSTSPSLDRFAEGATVFENAVAQASWTKASVASMWSGVWPPAHGATGWAHRLPERFETVAERLAAAGYQAAAFVTNVNAGRAFGLAQGFEHLWVDRNERASRVHNEVVAWLEAKRDPERPLFLYVHTMEPHAAYNPREPYRSRFAPRADEEMVPRKKRWLWPVENLPHLSALYDGEIAQNDDAFGALIESLRAHGLYEDALIVVLSDHGEEFREHGGWRHNRVLNYGSLDLPLIVKFPRQAEGARSAVPASHVDVLPTILDVAGPSGAAGEGQSLVAPRLRPVFSHLLLGREPLQYSVVDRGFKLIEIHEEAVRHQLYDLERDRRETQDLSERLPARVALLRGLLRQRLATTGEAANEEVELTDDLERSLRALGYLD